MIKRFLLTITLLIAPFSWAVFQDDSAGYATVTVNAANIDEAVPFFIVYGSSLPADFHTAMSDAGDTDGHTLRVTSSDGATQYAAWPCGVNTSTDTFALFVVGTAMSASVDVDFRVYVGDTSLSMDAATDTYGRNAVFAGYAGFYLPGMSLTDLTGNGRDLTAVNTPGTAASAYEGITAATYATNKYHHNTSAPAVTNWPVTLEAIAFTNSTTTGQDVISLCRSSNNQPLASIGFSASNKVTGYYRGDDTISSVATSSASAGTSTYKYLATNRDANTGTTRTYINGSADGTSATTLIAPTFDRICIGAWARGTPIWYLNGNVAAAYLSSSVRSANYVSTMPDIWSGAAVTAGAWTAIGGGITPGSTGWVLFQTAATTSASGTLADWTSVNNALVDDATYTTASLDGGGPPNVESETLKLTNPAYGTTIPTGATSYTVEFRIKRARGTGGRNEVDDLNVQFIDDTGTLVGSNVGALTTDWPTTAATRDYIATGLTLDGTEFTSAAGLAISATAANAARAVNARVLVAWIRISWTGSFNAFPLYLIPAEE